MGVIINMLSAILMGAAGEWHFRQNEMLHAYCCWIACLICLVMAEHSRKKQCQNIKT